MFTGSRFTGHSVCSDQKDGRTYVDTRSTWDYFFLLWVVLEDDLGRLPTD